jgi:hypothetical protein
MVETDDSGARIVDKIGQLRNQRKAAGDDLDRIIESLNMQRMYVATLDAQIAVLKEMVVIEKCRCELDDEFRAADVVFADKSHHASNCETLNGGTVIEARLRPSDAVVTLLKKRPRLRLRQILDKLEYDVESAARDTRHTLRSTVVNLVKSGRLYRLEDGTYKLIEEPEG